MKRGRRKAAKRQSRADKQLALVSRISLRDILSFAAAAEAAGVPMRMAPSVTYQPITMTKTS